MLKPPGHSIQAQPPYEGLFALQVKIKKRIQELTLDELGPFNNSPKVAHLIEEL